MSSYIGHAQNTTIPSTISSRIPFPSLHIGLGNGFALGILYLFVQRLLRYQRERRLLNQYRKETTAKRPKEKSTACDGAESPADGRLGLDLGKMTFTQASKIQKELAQLEFPYTFGHSLELGFIQVCSLPMRFRDCR
jgi:hypothetical protein